MNPYTIPWRLCRQGFLERPVLGLALSVLALLAVTAIAGGTNLPAQHNAPPATKPTQRQQAAAMPAQPRSHAAARASSIERQPVPKAIAASQPVPPAPNWPADQPPNQAKVSWDSRGLEIEASNSSLEEILHQVAADTGAKMEGITRDQRIFGTYGPGPAREVLSKLLDGSGYNVLMIGSRDGEADAPLEVVLTVSSPATPETLANNRNRGNSEDDDAVEPPDPEPPRPQAKQTPFGNGDSGAQEPPRQIMQDILERQQKIDQQQQKQDQQNNAHQ